MKAKLLTVVSLTIFIASGLLLWRWDDESRKTRTLALEAEMRSRAISLSSAVTSELRALRRSILASNPSAGSLDWASLRPVQGMATVQYDAGGVPVLVAWAVDDKGEMAALTAEAVFKLVQQQKSVPAVGEDVLARLSGSGARQHLLLMIPAGNRWGFFWLGKDWLQGTLDQLKGSPSEIFLVNGEGAVFSHSVREYVGTTLSADSVWGEIVRTERPRGAGAFTVAGQTSYAVFDRVPRSSFSVVSVDPDYRPWAGSWTRWLIGLGVAFGATLLTGGLIHFLVVRTEEASAARVREAESRARAAAARIEAVPVPQPALGSSPKEKMEAYMKIASALGHELRAPMMGILGQAQIALGRLGDEAGARESLENIIRESRSAREVLDKLFIFAGEAPPKKEKMKIETLLAKIFNELEPKMAQKGVKLVKDLRETCALEIDPQSLGKALKAILLNAVESMDRMAKKEIRVGLSENPDRVEISIADTGEGIEAEDLAKVYDPFYTTRSRGQHLGLGLSVALGVFKEHGAEIKIESRRGQGTKVTGVFPKKQATVEIQGRKVELRTEETVFIPRDLPPSPDPLVPPPPAPMERTEPRTNTLTSLDFDALLEPPPVVLKKNEPSPPPAGVDEKTLVLGKADAAGKVIQDVGSFVQPPSFSKPTPKSSALDGFRAEVRRPGEKPT